MSLYKTKHLTHIANKKRKSFKIEVAGTFGLGGTYYSMVWFMDAVDRPYWERVSQKSHPYMLTGRLKCCLKSKGRGRPHIFQKYVAPQKERSEECLYIN